ncbi:MAG: choice-of-anchor D domain-containing protein [Bacteroidetes bacterium]|nr:choice-of-anchor D domain-containing protein [Bacteroidota bacterium]
MAHYTEFQYTLGKNDHLKSSWPIKSMLVFIILFLCSFNAISQTTPITFSFTLSASARTSAGVYNSSGTLIRTLWSGVSYNAGTFSVTWDKKDDYGNLMNGTDYTIKVLSNNVAYNWDGVVGNTSSNKTGSGKIRHLRTPEDICIAGGKGFYCTGFVEGNSSANVFSLSSIQSKSEVTPSQNGDVNLEINYNATDGNYVYWSGFDAYGTASATYATKVSDGSEVLFSSGTSVSMQWGRTYSKAIDVQYGRNTNPSGIAVQKTGNYLFISHKGQNYIGIFNKSTGASVGTYTITSPGDLTCDEDNNLWAISGTNTLKKYSVSNSGALTEVSSISGLSQPISLSSYDTLLAVADAGVSQIIFYSINYGTKVKTLGQYNGYASSAKVENDKFYFWDNNMNIVKGFVGFGTDGSIWVGDCGNNRMIHFSASGTFIEQIMYMPMSYSSSVNVSDPTRVYSDFLEFKIDYSKSLEGTNGSWVLAYNWKPGLNSNYWKTNSDTREVFRNCVTLSNGKTYGTILYTDPNTEIRYPEVVELVDGGRLRLTGIRFNQFSNNIIEPDGTHRYMSNGKWYERKLTGFSNNNPVWSSASQIGLAPSDSDSPLNGTLSNPEKTSGDMLILFDKSYTNTGFHLAAVKKGSSEYAWKTCPSTSRTYTGAFPSDGAFDIGNNVEYAGGMVLTADRNIFWNYIGEFWKNSQTNKWNHYYDNGLFVAQFGITTPEAEKLDGHNSPRMAAGNAFSGGMVKVGNDYYIYHCDESVHGGIHRWKVSGLNTIQEQVINLGTTTAAEIDIKGNGVSIVKGATSTLSTNNTDFGSINNGTNTTKTFTIHNTGNANLTVSNITISGTNGSDFSLTSQPSFPLTIAENTSYSFSVNFSPTVIGTKTAKITVTNNDADEGTYDFAISGISLAVNTDPKISVSGNFVGIADGDLTPSTQDNTDFGTTTTGTAISKTFVISNTGKGPLSISNIVIGGTNASDFVISSNPSFPLSIAISATYSFTIRFNASSAGSKSATVQISSNDPALTTYDFAIAATANAPKTIIMEVKGATNSIQNGDNTPSTSDNTDFGSVVSGQSTSRTFVISNTGNSRMTISSITFGGTNASEFNLSNAPSFPLTIAGGASQTITVVFSPKATGTRSGSISISSNSNNASTYSFSLQGTGTTTTTTRFKDVNTKYSAYPNTTGGRFKLVSKRSSTEGEFVIVNSVGQTILNGALTEDEIDITGNAEGYYFVYVITPEGTDVVKVLLKY